MSDSENFRASEWPLVPAGYKPGDTPPGIGWRRSVCLIIPPDPDESFAHIQREVSEFVRRNGYKRLLLKAQKVIGFGGQRFNILQPSEAAGLYSAIHRERVFVVTTRSVRVQLDVTEKPSNTGSTPVFEYVRYKAGYKNVSRLGELPALVKEMEAYFSSSYCDDLRDPRCLPFCLFDRRDPNGDLNESANRSAFRTTHAVRVRNISGLEDKDRRQWLVDEFHTRDLIHVAGHTLPIGFHWNVQARRPTVLINGWEKWTVGGGGYTNVHPDAKIRGGDKADRVAKLASAPQELYSRAPAGKRSEVGRRKKNTPR